MKYAFYRLLILIVLVLGLSALMSGFFASPDFQGTHSIELSFPQQKVWDQITTLDLIPKRRKLVQSIDRISDSEWIETTGTGGTLHFRVIKSNEPEMYHIRLVESTYQITGDYVYTLTPLSDGRCRLTLSENSTIDHYWIRVVLAFMGRKSNLKHELRLIDESLNS